MKRRMIWKFAWSVYALVCLILTCPFREVKSVLPFDEFGVTLLAWRWALAVGDPALRYITVGLVIVLVVVFVPGVFAGYLAWLGFLLGGLAIMWLYNGALWLALLSPTAAVLVI